MNYSSKKLCRFYYFTVITFRNFLYCVLSVFENPHTAEEALKLNTSFFWGLCCTDKAIRSRLVNTNNKWIQFQYIYFNWLFKFFLLRYFAVLEKNFPRDFYGRLLHIMSKENWQSMGTYFWITHVIHLMLLSRRRPISIEQSSTPDGTVKLFSH